MTRRLNFWLFSVLLVFAIPYYWFLADAGAGPWTADARARPITMAELRALAGSIDGQRPVELRVETVGIRQTSRNMLIAGGGMKAIPNAVRAYELIVPGSGPVVIDAGASAKVAKQQEFDYFDTAAQARIASALSKAAHAILLADRPAHNGGFHAGTLQAGAERPSTHAAPYALAPGVVVIPATGLAPGSNMVYARLADDREFLFTGDVAKITSNWLDLNLPARIAMRNEPASFRIENLSWLMTINALHRSAPQMMIVTGHEQAAIPFSAGTFSD
ncbi:hypothetical protein [Novosphingobium kaempferiae]|uniref:hypothetical protein n=1 Tax=Novosphingobium kaempferiae TaxID=2896849 RepID=UPI001E38ABDC|nr:hypothetical protein [Novosphingobium kaempferiae]